MVICTSLFTEEMDCDNVCLKKGLSFHTYAKSPTEDPDTVDIPCDVAHGKKQFSPLDPTYIYKI